MKRLAYAAVAASFVPLVVGLVAVRPATAVTSGYEQYALTALASGVRTAGDVGASGGLVTLDTGSAYVNARLDAAPSSGVLADPYEPGTLARTVVGQVNAGAGEQVLDVPDAEAQYPGEGKGDFTSVPPVSNPPVTSAGGSATAKATETSAEGTATGSGLAVAGAFDSGTSSSSVKLSVDPASGVATAAARTVVSRVVVGPLELRDLVADASITTSGDTHTPKASLTVGGASVAGQAVTIDQDGVQAVGTPLVPGSTVQDATKQANTVLTQAGIAVHAAEVVRTSSTRSAAADTGGVVISLITAELPNGLAPGNRLEVVVGGVSLTETDEPPVPVLALPVDVPPVTAPVAEVPPVTTTTVIPGTPGIPGSVDEPVTGAPVVAAPQSSPAAFLVGGRRLSAAATLAAFAVWQFLTLGTATLYAVVDRRRRVAARLAAL
ncbi:MAG: hypothetical protein JWN77_797 [Frankiales bacterium]|nr:hypothetical protein [Frankiales bacterium]